MTMIDEDFLTHALAELGGDLELPEDGLESILAAAGTSAPESDDAGEPGTVRRATEAIAGKGPTRYLARHRHLAVAAAAAAVVVVAGGTVYGVLGRSNGQASNLPAALAPSQAQRMEAQLGKSSHSLANGTENSSPSLVPGAGKSAAAAITSMPQPGARSGGSLQYSAAGASTQANAGETPLPGRATSSGSPQHAASSPAQTSPNLPPGAVGSTQAIEKTGSVAIVAGKGRFEETMNRLTVLATGEGGFVQDSQSNTISGSPTGTVTLEVPVADFETTLNQVRSLGKVESVSTKATDVTGQVVDLQSRIQALQESLSQYEKILAHASSIGDVLSVQSQIDSIQSQIEQLQGQQNLLNAVTVYSTLAVSVAETPPTPRPVHHPRHGIAKAWHDTIAGFTAAFDGLVSVAGPLLFALLCLIAFVFVLRVAVRATRRWLI